MGVPQRETPCMAEGLVKRCQQRITKNGTAQGRSPPRPATTIGTRARAHTAKRRPPRRERRAAAMASRNSPRMARHSASMLPESGESAGELTGESPEEPVEACRAADIADWCAACLVMASEWADTPATPGGATCSWVPAPWMPRPCMAISPPISKHHTATARTRRGPLSEGSGPDTCVEPADQGPVGRFVSGRLMSR
jgi:hypothetical protein